MLCKIVGDGPLKDKLIAAAEGLLGVDFIGYLPNAETMNLLKSCDCFVLPCIQAYNGDCDGIPIVLMEAMSLGLPVISTSISGIPELVENGISGILVPEKSPVALADAIQWMSEHPEEAKKMGMAGREKVNKHFSLQKVVRELAKELERCCR